MAKTSQDVDHHEGHREKIKRKSHFAEWRMDLIAAMGEFIGTVLFLIFSLGAVQAAANSVAGESLSGEIDQATDTGTDAAKIFNIFYISFAFGFSLFAIASIFYRFTGSIFNPSVGIALMLIGAISPFRFILTTVSQLVGAIVAAAIVDGLTPGPLSVACVLGSGVNRTQGLFIEMFTTSALTLSVLMLAAEKSRFTPMAPLGFGMTLMVVMLFSTQYTGGAVNTARAFGPAVITGFTDYHWIYWLGPTLGSLLATFFYYILKALRYWEVNPGQDSVNHKDAPLQDVQRHGFSARMFTPARPESAITAV